MAKLGDCAGACAELERLVDEVRALDIEGLELGAIYEARTRVAIWMADRDAAERFGRLTAQEYRYGQGSPLGARYERLWDEARVAGVTALPELQDIKSSTTTSYQRTVDWTADRPSLHGTHTSGARAERALKAVCEATGARSGHLYAWNATGFELTASHGEVSPDVAFGAQIASRLTASPERDDDATMIEAVQPRAAQPLRGTSGVMYRVQLLPAAAGARMGAVLLDSAARVATDAELRELARSLG